MTIYNWKELNDKYQLNSDDEFELIKNILKEEKYAVLEEIEGSFAGSFEDDKKIILARDIFGLCPWWHSLNETLVYSDEKKEIENKGLTDIKELDPKCILVFDKKNKKINFIERPFFPINPEHNCPVEEIRKRLSGLVINAIAKRIPDKKFGIMFSGGVDSTLIAFIAKKLGVDFKCYTAVLDEEGMSSAEDMIYSEKIAKNLGFDHKIKKLKLTEVPERLKKLVPQLGTSNVVKVGVALPEFVCCEMAKEDNVDILFSGLGSEEIFAGYDRHDKSNDINEECVNGLKMMFERDTYRDYLVGKYFGIGMRTPFLDKDLVKYSLKIPSKFKIVNEQKKMILRWAAEDLGLPTEFAQRPKKAAQYGSKFDRAIAKLAKRNGYEFKKDYLKKFE